ncbi:hypothetical protein HYX04_04075 [Candidatus Woesearchaeota archaeon]|nr:hypothetical protein [Candidatus Woesearchaeota archaeon]
MEWTEKITFGQYSRSQVRELLNLGTKCKNYEDAINVLIDVLKRHPELKEELLREAQRLSNPKPKVDLQFLKDK